MGFICTALIFPGSLENRAVQEKQVCKCQRRGKVSRVWAFSGTKPTLPPHRSSRWQDTRSFLPNTTYNLLTWESSTPFLLKLLQSFRVNLRAHCRRTSMATITDTQVDVGSSDLVGNLQAIVFIMR